MIEAAFRRYDNMRTHLRHLEPIDIDSSFEDMSVSVVSDQERTISAIDNSTSVSSQSSSGASSEELGREIVINIDSVPVACCCVGVMIGHALRCGPTSGAFVCTPLNTLICVSVAYCIFSDLCSDFFAAEMEHVMLAIATAASAHSSELQPIRDISDLALPSYPFDPSNGEMEPTCSVCQEDFEPNEAVCHLYCGHTFHPACIYKWALYKDDCPMCRTKLESRRSESQSEDGSNSVRESLS